MKPQRLFQVISEWDIGLRDDYFETYDSAHEAARKALLSNGIDDPIEELIGETLVDIVPIMLKVRS